MIRIIGSFFICGTDGFISGESSQIPMRMSSVMKRPMFFILLIFEVSPLPLVTDEIVDDRQPENGQYQRQYVQCHRHKQHPLLDYILILLPLPGIIKPATSERRYRRKILMPARQRCSIRHLRDSVIYSNNNYP